MSKKYPKKRRLLALKGLHVAILVRPTDWALPLRFHWKREGYLEGFCDIQVLCFNLQIDKW